MRTRWAAVLLATGLVVAGCGSNGGQGGGASSPTPATSAPTTEAPTSTASAEVCAAAASAEASLNRLLTVTIGPNTVTELQNDLREVQSSLTTLVDTARADWKDQTAEVQASLTTLQAAVQQLANNPGTATVTAAKAALVGVETAAHNLFVAVSASCPGLSPSPS